MRLIRIVLALLLGSIVPASAQFGGMSWLAGPKFVISNATLGSTCAGSGTGGTTCTVTLTLTAGDTVIIGTYACDNSVSANCATTPPAVSSISGSPALGTCTLTTGTRNDAAIAAAGEEQWWCHVPTGGSNTITVTRAANGQYLRVGAFDASQVATSPDEGVGNTAANISGFTNISTNGAITQAVSLVFCVGTYGSSWNVPTGWTQLWNSGSVGYAASYTVTAKAGTVTYANSSGSSLTADIGAYK